MVNRINLILQAMNITPKQFAEEIGIQPSGMSHILSGRNQPSRDFVTKVIRRYPEISIKWLMLGDGPMYDALYAPAQTQPQTQPVLTESGLSGETPRVAVSQPQPSPTESTVGSTPQVPLSSRAQIETARVNGSSSSPDLFSSIGMMNPANTNADTFTSAANNSNIRINPNEVNHPILNKQTQSDSTVSVPSDSVGFSVADEEMAKYGKKDGLKVDNVEPLKNEQKSPVSTYPAQEMPIGENQKNETGSTVDFNSAILANHKKIVKMIVIYDDHTFAEYHPE